METFAIEPPFRDIIQKFGDNGAQFLLASALYHAREISFGAAAALAGITPEAFHERLRTHFGHGFILADDVVDDDIDSRHF